MGFSGVWVVWSLLGAPGEKKRENQMYLQDYLADFLKNLQNFAKNRKKIAIFCEISGFLQKVLIFAKIADFLQNFTKFLKI